MAPDRFATRFMQPGNHPGYHGFKPHARHRRGHIVRAACLTQVSVPSNRSTKGPAMPRLHWAEGIFGVLSAVSQYMPSLRAWHCQVGRASLCQQARAGGVSGARAGGRR
jgi:hypothetical protein